MNAPASSCSSAPHHEWVAGVERDRLERLAEDREAAVEHVFRGIEAHLDVFPVMLWPGEATWISEQVARGDWNDEGLVDLLGPSRVAQEVPLGMLLDEFLYDEDYGQDIQAALPPIKRAELARKLDALAQDAAGDPEELAWLRETYPTFFD